MSAQTAAKGAGQADFFLDSRSESRPAEPKDPFSIPNLGPDPFERWTHVSW
jgi:hypothetical protein